MVWTAHVSGFLDCALRHAHRTRHRRRSHVCERCVAPVLTHTFAQPCGKAVDNTDAVVRPLCPSLQELAKAEAARKESNDSMSGILEQLKVRASQQLARHPSWA